MQTLPTFEVIGWAMGAAAILGLIWSPRWKRMVGARLIALARFQEEMRKARRVAWARSCGHYETVMQVAAGRVEVMTFPPVGRMQEQEVDDAR